MKIVRPFDIPASSLAESSVLESEGMPWNILSTYSLGDVAVSDHHAYESLQSSNTGHDVTDPAWWLDLGATNRWAMFDQSNGSQTSDADSIYVKVNTEGRFDTVALLNISGSSVHVIASTAVDGVLFDETYSLELTDGIGDWYAYFFTEVERKSDLIVQGLPAYADMTIEVTVTATGDTAKVGNLIIGRALDLGGTTYGAKIGIIDYSKKTADAFGNYIITKRTYSKRGTFNVFVDAANVDIIYNKLTYYRATPVVWIGSDDYSSTFMYGFYRDFNVEIAYPTKSFCSLEIEGLS